jgi:hypothetical protein
MLDTNLTCFMPHSPVSTPSQKPRKQFVEEINRAMARFPLVVQILGELNRAPVPSPGDADIRHGCDRALTSILSELARIGNAPEDKSCKAEEIAQNWLQIPEARKLIDADKLQRMQQLIDCILISS